MDDQNRDEPELEATSLVDPDADAPARRVNPYLKWGLIGLAVAVVVAVGWSTLRSDSSGGGSPNDDARITSCTTADSGFMTADVEITNSSSERSNYAVIVSFRSADGSLISAGHALAGAMEPDQTVTVTAFSRDEATGEFTCTIDDVERSVAA